MLWKHCQTQWRGVGFTIIGLDYGEARRMADDLFIEWTYGLLRKLQALERVELKRLNSHDTDHGNDHQPATGDRQNKSFA